MVIEVPYFKYTPKYKLWSFINRRVIDEFDIQLKVYDGIPGSPWNGGRAPLDIEPDMSLPVSFALTNHTIEDFDDPISHEYLSRFDREGNGIILSNLELLDNLKLRYKHYHYVYSITAYDIRNGFDGYDEIEKKFDYIVPRNEIVNEGEFLKRNTKQYILLYSFECSYCPLYIEHYRLIGGIQHKPEKYHLIQCWFKDRKLLPDAGYKETDYADYEYICSGDFHHKLREIDPSVVGGYKIGRNSQGWLKIEEELGEIIELLRVHKAS